MEREIGESCLRGSYEMADEWRGVDDKNAQ
jgi:hypothetical protein